MVEAGEGSAALRPRPDRARLGQPGGLHALPLEGLEEAASLALVQRTNWGRRFQDPVSTVWDGAVKAWQGAGDFVHPGRVLGADSFNPSFGAADTFDFVCLVLLLVLLVASVRLLSPSLSIFAAAVSLLPLANPPAGIPLMSLPRLMLSGFPVFLVLGAALARSRVALGFWLVASTTLGVYLTLLFVSWRWVA